MKLSELRDRLQDEFEERDPPIQWGTFMLGKVAQLEAENEALKEKVSKLELLIETTQALMNDVY